MGEPNIIEIDAKLNMLVAQREQALNQVVNMAAVIACLQARINELERPEKQSGEVKGEAAHG